MVCLYRSDKQQKCLSCVEYTNKTFSDFLLSLIFFGEVYFSDQNPQKGFIKKKFQVKMIFKSSVEEFCDLKTIVVLDRALQMMCQHFSGVASLLEHQRLLFLY